MAQIYGNRWKNVGSLSAGGQADVFRVVDISGGLAGEWALKRLRRKDRVSRFRQEVAVLKRLQHDNIIKLVDAVIQENGGDEDSFLVMPIAVHGDLDERLEIYTGNIDSVVQVAKQIAHALECAHSAKVIHRDIKPGNILFPEVGHKVWVADFGLSLDQEAARNTVDGEVVGPRFFIAPELDDGGSVPVTVAADIYSLGQLMFYMLSGGRRISRENVFDERFGSFFSRGPRYDLLRLLLNKMIAPLGTRYSDIANVLRELAQIEEWEKRAGGGLLDPKALAATAGLQRRSAEELHRKATAQEIRRADLEQIGAVTASVVDWLVGQLEATKSQITAGDVLWARVEKDDAGIGRSVKVDTGQSTLLEERGFAMLSVRMPEDEKRTVYAVRFVVACEVRMTLSSAHMHYLGEPGKSDMALFPMFYKYSDVAPHLNQDIGYFYGKPRKFGVRDPIPMTSALPYYREMTSRNFHDGGMAIVRFTAADWPAVHADFKEMMTEVLSRMMQRIPDENR